MVSWQIGVLCIVTMATPIINSQSISSAGCGDSKGCFLDPPGCASPLSCRFFLSWTIEADGSNMFEMTGDVDTYVAVGFSKSGFMQDSDVYACTHNGEVIRARNGEDLHDNQPQPLKGVSDVDVSSVDGRIECRFKRMMTLNDGDPTYYDLRQGNTYHIIMAKSGIKLKSNDRLDFHYSGQVVGPRTSFTSYTQSQVPEEDCSVSNGCFQSPQGCGSNSDPCEFSLTWKKNADGSYRFEMSGNADSYVAVGFSKSGAMADSDVYACTSNSEVVRSRNTEMNINDKNVTLKGVSDTSVSLKDGHIECSFTRVASLDDNDDTFFHLGGDNIYTIIMSKSSSFLWPDGNIMYHFGGKIQGPAVLFTDRAPPGGMQPTRFQSPMGCGGPGETCDFEVKWRKNGDRTMRFEVSGTGTAFVALGFSKSGAMSNSEVYGCTKNLEIVRSMNTEANLNDKDLPLKGVSDSSVALIDDRIECNFTRQISSDDNDDTFFDLSPANYYTIIMAKSDTFLWPDGNIMYHFDGKVQGPVVSFTAEAPRPTMAPGADGCGTTMGCFSFPPSCPSPAQCEFFASWQQNNDNSHTFHISGNTETYVALGFSKSGRMADSDVYACTVSNEIVRSRNKGGNSNDKSQPLKGVSDETVTVADGRIECTFTRQAALNDNDKTYFDLREPNRYHIIMAKSNGQLSSDGNIMRHSERTVSGSDISFNEFASASGSEDNMKRLLQKTHGILMIIAWVGFASIGITLARYMKPLSPGTKVCDDKPIWFAVHRFNMVSAFLCTVVAFVIIFVTVGGFVGQTQGPGVDTRFIHAIVGTIVTFLAIANPIMAAFRPHPGEPRRPLFNWAHWAVGTGALLLGYVAICLALAHIRSARPLLDRIPSFLFWVMIVYIAIHFITWCVLEIRTRTKKDDASDSIPLKTVDDPDIPVVKKNKSDTFMNVTFFIFVFAVSVVTLLLVLTIALE